MQGNIQDLHISERTTEKILEVVYNAEPPITSKRNVDTTKCCEFHKNYGHTTEEYVDLKDEKKMLIHRGKLTKYTYT